jgi:hypothetical protein
MIVAATRWLIPSINSAFIERQVGDGILVRKMTSRLAFTGIRLDARTMAGAAASEISPVMKLRREVWIICF